MHVVRSPASPGSRPPHAVRVRSALKMLPMAAVLTLAVASPSRAAWKTFTTADGLASNYVRCVVEDDEETLWFATWSGISHYDGVSWRTFTRADGLASDSVDCGFKASDGSLWFGMEGGGASRILDGTVRTYHASDGLGSGTVASISEDRSGRIWFATTNGGATWFDGVSWGKQPGLSTESIFCVFEDHAGDLWFGTNGFGVFRCTGSSCTRFSNTNSGLLSGVVRAIAEDAHHHLWFATNKGVSSRDTLGSWTNYTVAQGLAGSNVWSVIVDRAERLWFGSSSGGASRFDGHWWRRYDKLAGYFTGYSVFSVTQDRSGNVWLATNAGAARFDGSDLTTFADVPVLGAESMLGIFQDRDGDLWVGSDSSGVFRFDGTEWTSWYPETAIPFPMQDSAGNRWFPFAGTGLLRVDSLGQSTMFTSADGLVSDYPRMAIEGKDHDVWVAHVGGVSQYDGSTWTAYFKSYTGDGLAGDNVFGAFQDRDGSLWFGTGNEGVSRLDSLGDWKTFTTQNGLGGNWVLVMFQADDGSYWFTTPGAGVNHFFGEPTPGGVERLTTADGLRNDWVLDVTQTRDGDLWFTLDHGGGVMRWDGTDWRGIGIDDGLPSGSCHKIFEDRTGDLWISTSRGVARFERDEVPPRTVIARRPPVVSGSRSQSALFTALGESDRLEFSYRLDGGGWSDWSNVNGWSAQGLGDGLHVLEVRSRDYWVNVDPTPEAATFEIDATPPLPAITAPASASAVRGVAEIRGTASDARFRSYEVLARPSEATSWDPPAATVIGGASSPVPNGTLASWNTTGLPDGLYDVRVSVVDSLDLVGVAEVTVVVDNHPPFVDVTSPAKVTAASGGDVFTTNAGLHLYFPPHAFREDAIVVVTPRDRGSVNKSLTGPAVLEDPGYEISWSGGALEKPARLQMSYADSIAAPSRVLALYRSDDGVNWQRLGGTVDSERRVIELAIERSGSYALFTDQGAPSGRPTLSALSFTPRVFSPTGGYADREVGISFTLGRPGAVTVRVYNRAGRLIREVVSGASLGAGANLVRWDGTDRSGLTVPDGLYVVTVEAFGETEKKPLAVVR